MLIQCSVPTGRQRQNNVKASDTCTPGIISHLVVVTCLKALLNIMHCILIDNDLQPFWKSLCRPDFQASHPLLLLTRPIYCHPSSAPSATQSTHYSYFRTFYILSDILLTLKGMYSALIHYALLLLWGIGRRCIGASCNRWTWIPEASCHPS